MNVLDSIVRKKRERLAAGVAVTDPVSPRHSPGELLDRFRSAALPVIAEIKQASPSGGVIRPHYDPVEIALQYQAAGAFAVSVLTEQDFFLGSLDQLRAVRAAVDVPLLRKDFLIVPEQLRESRDHGADMALLIVACLDQEQLRALIAAAGDEGILPLVEVHDEEEADRAMDAGAKLLGINNRNLKTLKTDLQTGVRVAGHVRRMYGDDVVIVGESGIHTSADMQRLAEAGCGAFLIGESLLRAPEPGRALADLLAEVADRKSQIENPKSAVPDLRPAIFDPRSIPDPAGHYGPYGGKFVPETLMAPLEELESAYGRCAEDAGFQAELASLLRHYVGRPTPLTFAAQLSGDLAARIYFKREDLCHTGAHKINNALGQALLARRMGKRRIVAETGAGQHGVAVATVCALLGLECCVYMGVEDMARQELNVFRMRLLGAEVVPVHSGTRTLKDAINETMRDWVTHVEKTHYLLGSVLGPHPYPRMVRDFQSVIGIEARRQILEAEGKLPDFLIACVGGGSNSLGLFYPFLADRNAVMVGVEAGGRGEGLGDHAARFRGGRPGVLHGCYTYVLQDTEGQIASTHSVSAGLDYPAIGPEHALLHDSGRIRFTAASDREALEACRILSRREGLIPALESAHAVAELLGNQTAYRDKLIIVNLSGRGDKDMPTLQREIES